MTKQELDELCNWFVSEGGHKYWKEWLSSNETEKALKEAILTGTGRMLLQFDEESQKIWGQSVPLNFNEEDK